MDSQKSSSEGYKPTIMWHAMYTDGGMLSQYDGTTEYASETIDRTRLKAIILTTRDGRTLITKYFKPGQKLIYRARNALRPGQRQIDRIHIIGCEENGISHVIFAHESDFTINIGDFTNNQDTPWYYPVSRLPHDEILIGSPSPSADKSSAP